MTELFLETGDPPSELAIATVSGVDRMTVSQVTAKLIRRGLVSVGPDAVWPGLRLAPTRGGAEAAREGALVVEAESLRWLSEQGRRAA